jgi:biopolymer transport protein ExbD
MQIRSKKSTGKEPTIALINIVFLMLIFFMIAGTLAPTLDPDLKLIHAADLEGREPPDTLIIHADGQMSMRGAPIATAAEFFETLGQEDQKAVRIVPDRLLPAKDLVRIATSLRAVGAEKVMVVSERALK